MKKSEFLGKELYVSPELNLLEILQEGLLCSSPNTWYKQGGQGDFSYGVENDETWSKL